MLVNDLAYADVAFDGYRPPSLLQAEGADEVGVELYSLTKGHSMAGWRVGFAIGSADMIRALAKLKSYLDYGTFQPIQIASIIALNEEDGYPDHVSAIYQERRDTLIDGLARAGWKMARPQATMFVWAEIPDRYAEMGSLEFTKMLLREARVAVSSGIGFGPTGDRHVRFALVENQQRIAQAARGIRRMFERG